jgi:general secretion pathway protein F
MTGFRYRAIGPRGDVQTGIMDAVTEAEVIARLQRQGSIPMRAEPAENGSWFAGLLRVDFVSHQGMRRQEAADFIRELATMLGAGQDLDRAFVYLHETAPNARVRAVGAGLRDLVRDGSGLADAMAQYQRGFSRLHVAMVRAGEASGQLAPTLARLADLLERQQKLSASITSALIYPCLLVVASVSAIALLLTYVLPQFVPLFEQSGAALPASTQLLIATGAFIGHYGMFMLLGGVMLGMLVRAAYQRPRLRLSIDRLQLRIPIVNKLVREMLAARFTRVLGTLLVNGVSLMHALGLVRDAMGNRAAVAAVDRAATTARAGAGLSQQLAEAKVFPLRTTHLLRLGEENAELGPMALRIADIHEEHTRLMMQRLVALLVPAITVIMGLAVAGIVTSLLTAMLSLNDLAAG